MNSIQVPRDHLAAVVTYFEMTEKPADLEHQTTLALAVWDRPDLSEYRQLFQKIGNEWLWFGQLLKSDEELKADLYSDTLEIFRVIRDDVIIGLVELDFSEADECEIVYFGLVPEANGKRLGRTMMAETLRHAWKPGLKRVWLHTCTSDSPNAPRFYKRVGFEAYKREVEIHPDPRLTGHLPKNAGAHVPIIQSVS